MEFRRQPLFYIFGKSNQISGTGRKDKTDRYVLLNVSSVYAHGVRDEQTVARKSQTDMNRREFIKHYKQNVRSLDFVNM